MNALFLWGGLRRKAEKQIIHLLQQSRTLRELQIIQISLQGLWEIRRTLSKILWHCCPGDFFFPQVKTKRYCLTSSTGLLKNMLHKSNTGRNLHPVEMGVNWGWGLGTTGCRGITMLFIAQRSCRNLSPWCLGFLPGEIRELQRVRQEIDGPQDRHLQLASCLRFMRQKKVGFRPDTYN